MLVSQPAPVVAQRARPAGCHVGAAPARRRAGTQISSPKKQEGGCRAVCPRWQVRGSVGQHTRARSRRTPTGSSKSCACSSNAPLLSRVRPAAVRRRPGCRRTRVHKRRPRKRFAQDRSMGGDSPLPRRRPPRRVALSQAPRPGPERQGRSQSSTIVRLSIADQTASPLVSGAPPAPPGRQIGGARQPIASAVIPSR